MSIWCSSITNSTCIYSILGGSTRCRIVLAYENRVASILEVGWILGLFGVRAEGASGGKSFRRWSRGRRNQATPFSWVQSCGRVKASMRFLGVIVAVLLSGDHTAFSRLRFSPPIDLARVCTGKPLRLVVDVCTYAQGRDCNPQHLLLHLTLMMTLASTSAPPPPARAGTSQALAGTPSPMEGDLILAHYFTPSHGS